MDNYKYCVTGRNMGSCEYAKIPVEADLAVFLQNYYFTFAVYNYLQLNIVVNTCRSYRQWQYYWVHGQSVMAKNNFGNHLSKYFCLLLFTML